MAPSPTMRRLLRETAELSLSAPNPNPAFHAAPVSDADLHEWHFTLLGPPAPSPYAGGIYHGRITLPATYPLKPPNFRFLTPSGRFETNREICLSISGFHEETWMPAWGIRTALTALRTFMAEQGTAGQVGGLEASENVRKRLAAESRSWRCEGCGSGGRSNEEVMNEWWKACREKGVTVGEDGDVDLESLPDGVNLEARSPGPSSPKQPTTPTSSTSPGHKRLPSQVEPMSPTGSQFATPDRSDQNLGARVQPSTPSVPARSNNQQPIPRNQHSHSASNVSSGHRSIPSTNSVASMAFSTTATRTRMVEPAANEPANTTVDRAIGVLVLALCIMILKKIFYPAAGDPMDDFYLPDG